MKLGPSDLEIVTKAWQQETMSKSKLEGSYAEVHLDDLDGLLKRLSEMPGDAFIVRAAIEEGIK